MKTSQLITQATLLAFILFATSFSIDAAENNKDKVFDPRNINGSWDRYSSTTNTGPINPNASIAYTGIPDPALKPDELAAWKARQQAAREATARGEPPVTNYTRCLPDGMPAMMAAMFPMEVLVSPDRVTIIEEAYNQVRRIYMDEKQLPIEDAEPGFWGHSVGHWEGDTLVVDTVGIKDYVRYRDVPHSNKMRIHERIKLLSKDRMQDEVTVTDPEYLTAPWKFTFQYIRKPGYKLYEYVCEDNREFADPETGKQRLKIKSLEAEIK
jgi:hypothetical protein